MSRPNKQGIDYFPMDVNFDSEVKLLIADKGIGALGVWVTLLQLIYSDNGYYIDNGKKLLLRLKIETMLEVDEIKQIIDAMLDLELFDVDKYEKYQILTSKGIQNRYFLAAKKRKIVYVDKNYLCEGVSVSDNTIYLDVNSEFIPQSKVKESKVNKSKVKESKEEDLCRVDDDLRDNHVIRDDKDPTARSYKNNSEIEEEKTPIITIPLTGQTKEFPITQKMVDNWQEDFPNIDVLAELHKMRAWSDANPNKRKTIKGVKRFVVSWLSRSQDKPNNPNLSVGGNATISGYSRKFENTRLVNNEEALKRFLEGLELQKKEAVL